MPDDMVEAHLRGVRNALAAGWRVLDAGGAALDAIEEAVVVMEDDETFDAGRGSFLNRDGKVQLDALIMDGATLRAGGVGCVERVRNPVRAARKILSESPHVYFVGEGAERFAAEHGVELCRNEELVIRAGAGTVARVSAEPGGKFFCERWERFVCARDFARHGGRGRAGSHGQHCRCHFYWRDFEQGSGTAGGFVTDRVWLLCGQLECGGFDHGLG